MQVKTWFQNRRMKQKKIYRKSPDDCFERRMTSGGDHNSFDSQSASVPEDIFSRPGRVPSQIRPTCMTVDY